MEDILITFFGFSFVIPALAEQVALAALMGLLLGSERAWRNKVASLRTFSMICAGSCLFTTLSVHGISEAGGFVRHDITRIAAQIVTGIGFLGGGVIFKTADRIEGITTAAMIWLAAALGMACGFNQVKLALWVLALWLIIDVTSILLHKAIDIAQERVGGNGDKSGKHESEAGAEGPAA